MANKVIKDNQNDIQLERLDRVLAFADGRLKIKQYGTIKNKLTSSGIEPNLTGIRDRTANFKNGKFLPTEVPTDLRNVTPETYEANFTLQDAKKISKGDFSKAKVEGADDYLGSYYMWNGTLQPEYDMREPHSIVDTEVYVKQTVSRKLALVSRAGYKITSDIPSDVDYIENRIENIEYVSERAFSNLIKGILRNLFLCSNCFLLKIRDEKATTVKKKDGQRAPVAAYTIIPSHTIHPYLKNGKIIKWRRFFDQGMPYKDVPLEDIIHFKWDVKPGHIFGTPRTIGVRDDIFALRRLEENIELLFLNHLFPLFHVQVGTPEAPCVYNAGGESEIDLIRWQIENMPKEGVFITDERVKVDAVGAEGKSLDYTPLVTHFKQRIYVGLGMSSLDMGEGENSSRGNADNISQNLKDSIKADLDEFAEQIRLFMFKEWFMEAGHSVSVPKAVSRIRFSFHEIDLDTRIKGETHTMALFNSHLITETEARERLNYKPIPKEEQKDTHFDLHVLRLEKETANAKANSTIKINEANVDNQKAMAATQMKLHESEGNLSERKTQHEERKLASQSHHLPIIAKAKVSTINASMKKSLGAGKPRSGTAKKSTQTAAEVGNKMRPTNQHGSNLGPTKAKSSRKLLIDDMNTGLSLLKDTMTLEGKLNEVSWAEESQKVIDSIFNEVQTTEINDSINNDYTSQIRDKINHLKSAVAETNDLELLSVLFNNILDSDLEEEKNGDTDI